MGVTHVAVQFPLYEKFKLSLHHSVSDGDIGFGAREEPIAPSTILASSALSKMIASAATYPHEVIRTRLQNQVRRPTTSMQSNKTRSPGSQGGNGSRFSYNGIIHAAKVIAHEEGFAGFYHGIVTNMIRTVPASALTILT